MGLMPVVIGQECDFGEFKWQTREGRRATRLRYTPLKNGVYYTILDPLFGGGVLI